VSINARPHEIDALFWGALEAAAKVEKAAEKGLIGSGYRNGQDQSFRDRRGMKLGEIRRSDPDPEWRLVDRAAFEADVRAKHPGVVQKRLEIVPGKEAEVLAVLAEHADHLLRDVEYIPEEVVTDALAHSADTGEAAGPGIEWVEPVGSLGVYPDKAAVEFLRKAMHGELDVIYPKALPAGEERAAS
jgi:hypothetical protein